jgi:hypothetical protein
VNRVATQTEAQGSGLFLSFLLATIEQYLTRGRVSFKCCVPCAKSKRLLIFQRRQARVSRTLHEAAFLAHLRPLADLVNKITNGYDLATPQSPQRQPTAQQQGHRRSTGKPAINSPSREPEVPTCSPTRHRCSKPTSI